MELVQYAEEAVLSVDLFIDQVDLPSVIDPQSVDGERVKRAFALIHSDYWEQYIIPMDSDGPRNMKNLSFRHRKIKLDKEMPSYRGSFRIELLNIIFNHDHQHCIAPSASSGNLVLAPCSSEMRENQMEQVFLFEEVHLCSAPVRIYFPQAPFIKGKLGYVELVVRRLDRKNVGYVSGRFTQESLDAEYRMICDSNVGDDEVLNQFIRAELIPYFKGSHPKYRIKKWLSDKELKAYRTSYPVSMQSVGLVGGYLSYMCLVGCVDNSNRMQRSVSMKLIGKLFQAALSRHPEIPNYRIWREIVALRLGERGTLTLNPSSQEVLSATRLDRAEKKELADLMKEFEEPKLGAFKYLFVKCLDVAVSVLSIVPTCRPYLRDVEMVPGGVPGSRRLPFDTRVTEIRRQQTLGISESAFSFGHRSVIRNPSLLPVERINDIGVGYGEDCEDDGVYCAQLARRISSHTLKGEGSDLDKEITFVLKNIFTRFVPCVANLMCRGSDLEPIYHSLAILIPRGDFYSAERSGANTFKDSQLSKIGGKYIREGPDYLAEWETAPDYIGTFVCEGTYIEEPHKFYVGERNEDQRQRFRDTSLLRDHCLSQRRLSRDGKTLLPRVANRILIEQRWNCEGVGGEGEKMGKYHSDEHPFYETFMGFERAPHNWSEAKTSSYVTYHTAGIRHCTKEGDRVRGLPAENLLSASSKLKNMCGFVSLDPLWDTSGQKAFEVSMRQYCSNFPPPLSMKPVEESTVTSFPDYLTKFSNELKRDQTLRDLFTASAGQHDQENWRSRYERYHVLETDLQDDLFRESAVSFFASLVSCMRGKTLDPYYAMILKVDEIGSCIYTPTHEDLSYPKTRSLQQILVLMYY